MGLQARFEGGEAGHQVAFLRDGHLGIEFNQQALVELVGVPAPRVEADFFHDGVNARQWIAFRRRSDPEIHDPRMHAEPLFHVAYDH
jgi:hypothetical protein